MPTLQKKIDIENPKITEGGALYPLHQAHISSGSDAFLTLVCSPAPPTNSLGSGKTVIFDIERDEVKQINDLVFRFKVSCSSADVQTVPINYWFSRLVIEAEKGSGDELLHLYPESWLIWDYFTEDRVGRELCGEYSNYTYVPIKSEGKEKFNVTDKNTFKAGQTRDVYLKLPALFFHLNAIDMSHIRSDLRFRFEMSNDIIISGDKNNLSLDSLELICRNFAEEGYDHNARVEKQLRNVHKYVYLDCERIQENSKTITAGNTLKLPLDQYTGKSAFMFIFIKPSTTPTASDKSLFNFVEIGENGTVDLTNPSSQSLLGQGTALKESCIYQAWSQHTGAPALKGCYMINFSENGKKAFAGTPNGWFEFVGLRDYIEITPDGQPNTDEVHTITTNINATSGRCRYGFENGVISLQDVDYNEAEADINNIINNIPQLQERDITVTVNEGLDATTSQTITFNANGMRVSDELGKLTLLANSLDAKVSNTAVTTHGRRGFTTGSNYQVEILMYKYKTLSVEKNGSLSCKDL